MKTKKISASIMLMLLVVALIPMTSAENNDFVEIEQVRINGDTAHDDDILYVERGDDLNLRVVLQANDEVKNAYMGAYISGYRHAHYEPHMVMAHSPTFNIPAGHKRSFNLNLEVPMEIEQKDAKLRLVLFDENSDSVVTYNYQLAIYGADEKAAVNIRNFFISPSETIEAGRALSFKVQVRNHGNFDLDDVTVKVEIPELNLQTFETIDWIEVDETKSFESLLLRIPQTAKAGNYEVIATVEYDRFQRTSESKTINIERTEEIKDGIDKVSVVTMPERVEIVAGTQPTQGSMYPILIENKGASSKTYTLSVTGHEGWATATFEPASAFVVQGGSSQTAFLRLKAHDDVEAGDKLLNVKVQTGDEVKENTVLANIRTVEEKEETDMNVRQILEWALVVLIIVLIILGLIVVFKKMKKNNEEEDEQTYY